MATISCSPAFLQPLDFQNMQVMRKGIIYLLMAGLSLSGCHSSTNGERAKPKLTILIGLDQFRADYLVQYNAVFTGGFRKILDEGFWYQNGIVDHAPTLSLPGHTTLSTGANPKTHGITSNAWINPKASPDNQGMIRGAFPHVDRKVKIVGDTVATAFSPHKIKVQGLADWFQQSQSEAKTVALSVSPLAVLYGGKYQQTDHDRHVYWLGSTGRFITSTYYRTDYPNWIDRFNETLQESYIRHHRWENTVPTEYQDLARLDSAVYEFDGIHTTFPHQADDFMADSTAQSYRRWFGRFSPYQNNALFDLAKEAIIELQLGQRESIDLLSIAVKLTDRIGHDFGPRSLEMMDVILRLDVILGEFIAFLDKNIGTDNYLLALSSDHGGPYISEYELEQGRKALRVSSEDIQRALDTIGILADQYKDSTQSLPRRIADRLEEFPFISKAFTQEDLEEKNSNDPYLRSFQNSYLPEQATTYPLWTVNNQYGNLISTKHPAYHGVIVELPYQANIWSAASTHGGAHDYDQEVPILFYGNQIKSGQSNRKVYTRDIAPTISFLSGVDFPATVDGTVLDFK